MSPGDDGIELSGAQGSPPEPLPNPGNGDGQEDGREPESQDTAAERVLMGWGLVITWPPRPLRKVAQEVGVVPWWH